MKNVLKALLLIFVVGAFFSACQKEVVMEVIDLKSTQDELKPAGEPTAKGVQPVFYLGNFVSSDDDQVCYDMEALGYIGGVTNEMRGFKIDPPVNFNNGKVNIEITPNGRYLNWEVIGETKVIAFIIKGGNGYNLYNYVPLSYTDDQDLHSPYMQNKKGWSLPQISHYNVCYIPPTGVDEGCTPGYWRNHADRWVGVAPGDDFDTTFGVDLFIPDVTLGWAIWAQGGGNNAFARHATAALLNAYAKDLESEGQLVNYPYTVADVIQMVKDAVANDSIEATKDLFEAANELGCPLSGTPADPVP